MLRPFTRPQSRTIDDQEAPAGDPAEEASTEPVGAVGPDVLYTGPLLSDWFVRYQLEREMDRSRRHGRPLSIVVLTPVPSLGNELNAEALMLSARAAAASSRTTDLVGWLPENRILLILPETDKDGATAAVYRLSTEMSSRTLSLGQLRWVATTWIDGFAYASADDLLAAVSAIVI